MKTKLFTSGLVVLLLAIMPIKLGKISSYLAEELKGRIFITRGQIISHIKEAAREHKVNPALVAAIVHAESGFDPMATSKSGAKGLMQINEITARHLNLIDVFDPRENIYAGVAYLKELKGRFGNNISLIAAAYNAGPGAVKKYAGIPPYRETQRYVVKVQKFFRQYSSSSNLSI